MSPVLEINELRARLRSEGDSAYVIDGLSFSVNRGEVVALVGESGSGKTLTAFSVLGLLPHAVEIVGGRIALGGKDILTMDQRGLRSVRGVEAAIVFQEPMTSLNPLMTIERQIAEMLIIHGKATKKSASARVRELLELVRMPDPARRAREYPHNLSGGLRQRAMIAMALACEPRLLIADEPTTALDVTIQAQILKLLLELRDRLGMAILLITHDLGVVAEVADRVAVMYAGRIVEQAPVDELFRHPRHPYTRGLLACLPSDDDVAPRRLTEISGLPPRPGSIVRGCAFAPRCTRAQEICSREAPVLTMAGPAHLACHNPWGN
jgi:peptide/nickel transport system ATP-binding protein